jgi:proteic killer suppression protein
MIQGFVDRRTQRLWVEREAGRFPPDLARRALAKLAQLDAAGRLDDLRVPPSNHLEALRGGAERWPQRPALDPGRKPVAAVLHVDRRRPQPH